MKRTVAFLLSLVMVLTLFGTIPAFAEDAVFEVTDGGETTTVAGWVELKDKINASTSADPVNVKLLQDYKVPSQQTFTHTFTLDGDGKALTADNIYLGILQAAGTFTIRNISITSGKVFHIYTVAENATNVIYDNVTVTVTAGLFANLNAGGAANTAANVLTVQNSTINTNGGTDPVIGYFHASSPWTINIENSTITNGRDTPGNDSNASTLNLSGAGAVTLNVIHSTVNHNRKVNAANPTSVFYAATPAKKTINVDADSTINIKPTATANTGKYFVVYATTNAYTFSGTGATYNVSAAALKRGVYFPVTKSNANLAFVSGGTTVINGGYYKNASASADMTFEIQEKSLSTSEKIAAGLYYRIGADPETATYFSNLVVAYTTASAGQTIYLVQNAAVEDRATTFSKKGLVIDGQGYTLAATVGYPYVVKASTTFQNLNLTFTNQGFSFRPQATGDTLTLKNVTASNNSGLFIVAGHGFSGNPVSSVDTKTNIDANISIQNSTITGNGEEVMLLQCQLNWNVSIVNSTLKKAGSNSHAYVMQIASGKNGSVVTTPLSVSVSVDGTSKLITQSTYAGEVPLFKFQNVTTTLNLANGATLENAATAVTSASFISGATNTTVNDNGANFTVGAKAATVGTVLPAISNWNGESVSARTVFSDGVTTVVNGGTYTNASATGSTTFTLTEREMTYEEKLAGGAVFRVGSDLVAANLYASFDEAIAAANAGDTIYYLGGTDIALGGNRLTINKNITFDGGNKKITSTAFYAIPVVGTVTIQNVTIEANQVFSYRPQANGDSLTLTNVTVLGKSGLMMAAGHDNTGVCATTTVKNIAASVNLNNCTLTCQGDEAILLQLNVAWTLNVNGSTLTYNGNGGADNGIHSMLINAATASTINIDGTSRLVNNTTGTKAENTSVVRAPSASTVNLAAGAVLEIGAVGSYGATNIPFVLVGANTVVNDSGTNYVASAAALEKGVVLPTVSTLTGKDYVLGFSDGTGLYKAGSTVTEAGATEARTFAAVGFNNSDFNLTDGASIRTESYAGIRFTTNLSADLLALIDANATYGTYLVPTRFITAGSGPIVAGLEAGKYERIDGLSKPIDNPDGSRQYYSALVNFPVNATAYKTQISAQSYFTLTYADGATATFCTAYVAANNSRSLYQVATALKALPGYETTPFIESIIQTVTDAGLAD